MATKKKTAAASKKGSVADIDREIAALSAEMGKRFGELHARRAKALESDDASDDGEA